MQRQDQLLQRDVRPRNMITIPDQLRKQRNTVPGEKTYAAAVQLGRETSITIPGLQPSQQIFRPAESLWSEEQQRPRPNIAIVGDSIVGGVKRRDMNRETKGNPVTIKTFRGATVDEMESYIIPTIKKQPDGLIVHCGTNNLRHDEPEVIASKILNLATESKKENKECSSFKSNSERGFGFHGTQKKPGESNS